MRHVHRLGNRLEMQVQTFLRRLVVVRHHGQRGCGTGLFRETGQFDGFLGGIRAGSGNHRNAPGGMFHRKLDQRLMFFHVNRG